MAVENIKIISNSGAYVIDDSANFVVSNITFTSGWNDTTPPETAFADVPDVTSIWTDVVSDFD